MSDGMETGKVCGEARLTYAMDSIIENLEKEVHALMDDVRLINRALLPPVPAKERADVAKKGEPKGWFEKRTRHLEVIFNLLCSIRTDEIARLKQLASPSKKNPLDETIGREDEGARESRH